MADRDRHQELMKRRKGFITRLLVRLAEHYKAKANDEIRASGFPDFADSHMQVLFNLEVDGNRITTLATRARITVQAMGKLVKDLEEKGYVERRPDPSDGRARIIALTDKGVRFFETASDIIEANERGIAEILGEDTVEGLGVNLRRIVDEVDPLNF